MDIYDDLYRYEVGISIDDCKDKIAISNDLEAITKVFEEQVEKYSRGDVIHHAIIYLYDYDKHANLNYYDNLLEQ